MNLQSLPHLTTFLFAAARRGWVVVALLGLLASPARAGAGAAALREALTPDGTVRAGVRGSFDMRGYAMHTAPDGHPVFAPAAPQGARGTLGPGDANWSDAFRVNDFDGRVNALVVDGAGNLYAGGQFTAVGGVGATNVAKWNGTAWSALGTGIDYGSGAALGGARVNALAVDGTGNLYAAGGFRTAGSVVANGIAKWNGSSWSALGTGLGTTPAANGDILALLVAGSGDVYVGGSFDIAGGVRVQNIAKWNGTTWSAVGPVAAGGGRSTINALAADGGGNVYAAGNFTTAGGVAAANVAKWDGTTWTALGAGINGTVYALAVDAGGVYAGGGFTAAGGAAAANVAKWSGAAWAPLGAGSSRAVFALAFDGSGNLYAGGALGTAAASLLKWDGTAWAAAGAGLNSSVRALARAGTDAVYAGGDFTEAGGQRLNRCAKWTASTAAWSRVGPLIAPANGLNSSVSALAVDGAGNLYVSYSFLSAPAATTVAGVARWNGTTWLVLGPGFTRSFADAGVNALAVDAAGTLYAGGLFSTVGPTAISNVAKWDGTAWTDVGGGITSSSAVVYALASDGAGNVYAVGDFASAGGVSARNVAKWNGTAWAALGSGILLGARVITADGSGNVYVGGQFTSAGGVPAANIAKWNGTAWSALGTGVNDIVTAVATDRTGNLYAAGLFRTAGGVAVSDIAKWNGTAWSAMGAGIGNNALNLALAADAVGNVYVGGVLSLPGTAAGINIAQWNGTAWSGLGTGTNNAVTGIAATPAGIYAGGRFTTVGDGSKAMSYVGFYSTAVPTAAATARPALSFALAPNPAHAAATVRLPAVPGATQATLTLLDALGRAVRVQRVALSVAGAAAELSLAGLAPGLYHVRVQAGGQQASRALLVE